MYKDLILIEHTSTNQSLIKIIDDDFEEILLTNYSFEDFARVIIKLYKTNDLISKNLSLYVLQISKANNTSTNDFIQYLSFSCKEFNEYKNEVEKILLFS